MLILNVGADEDNLQVLEIAKIIQKVVPSCELEFLSNNPHLDKEGLIRDRKLKDSNDTRTYKVTFGKIKRILPNFKCEWNVEKGIRDMVKLFDNLPLSSALFKSRGFYRLQQLEDLHLGGYVSDELFWLKPQGS